MQAQFTKELENVELIATQAGKASPNDAERLELWKSIDGVQSQSGKIYGRSAYSDNSVSEYFSKTASSSKTSSPVEHQMKDLSEKIDGFVGIAKKAHLLFSNYVSELPGGCRGNGTRIGSVGVVRRHAVHIYSLRRVNQDIYLLTTRACQPAFREPKRL
ncbi:hypothetical protein ACFE04_022579 [Oxalis oulophora]